MCTINTVKYTGIKIEEVINHINPCVNAQMNEMLDAEFTAEEVRKPLDSIGDLKAPGSDGMPAVFYKRYWDTVGERVVHEVLEVLQGGS